MHADGNAQKKVDAPVLPPPSSPPGASIQAPFEDYVDCRMQTTG